MKKLNELLKNRGASLAYLQKQVKLLESLTQHVRTFIPAEFASHCQVTRYDEQMTEIVVTIEEQNLLTPLRFLKPRLQKQLKSLPLFANLKEIQFIYAPVAKPHNIKREPIRSTVAAEACLAAAEFCQSPELRQNLTKLAQQLTLNHQKSHEEN